MLQAPFPPQKGKREKKLVGYEFILLIGFSLTLSQEVTLHITVIVLACPDIPSFTLECISHHVINQTVFIPTENNFH
jgi:hypothetical protein